MGEERGRGDTCLAGLGKGGWAREQPLLYRDCALHCLGVEVTLVLIRACFCECEREGHIRVNGRVIPRVKGFVGVQAGYSMGGLGSVFPGNCCAHFNG